MSDSNAVRLEQSPDSIVFQIEQIISKYRPVGLPERRQHDRELLSIPVMVQPLDDELVPCGPIFPAVTRDICGGGMGIMSTHAIESSYVALEIRVDDGLLQLVGRVQHSTPLGILYLTGVRFVINWDVAYN
ncbi:MAG: PilZ domain-containing protein [Pirellulaceae bacterium]|nr:PilZ domain-containing protein [Planctomycetales bacterium]MCA9264858.1 PilZ domain-containing protein [Planctomycetales bacterium]